MFDPYGFYLTLLEMVLIKTNTGYLQSLKKGLNYQFKVGPLKSPPLTLLGPLDFQNM